MAQTAVQYAVRISFIVGIMTTSSFLTITSFLDALHYSIDGNFQQNQRDKPMDAHDFPLTMGAAYFANEDEFKTYQSKLGPPEPDVRYAAVHIT